MKAAITGMFSFILLIFFAGGYFNRLYTAQKEYQEEIQKRDNEIKRLNTLNRLQAKEREKANTDKNRAERELVNKNELIRSKDNVIKENYKELEQSENKIQSLLAKNSGLKLQIDAKRDTIAYTQKILTDLGFENKILRDENKVLVSNYDEEVKKNNQLLEEYKLLTSEVNIYHDSLAVLTKIANSAHSPESIVVQSQFWRINKFFFGFAFAAGLIFCFFFIKAKKIKLLRLYFSSKFQAT